VVSVTPQEGRDWMREIEVVFPRNLEDPIGIYDTSTHEELSHITRDLVFAWDGNYANVYKLDADGHKYMETVEAAHGVYAGPAMEKLRISSVKLAPGCNCDSKLLAIAGCQCGKG